MRYFVCDLDRKPGKPNVRLGIPAGRTGRIIPANRFQTAFCETENGEAFILIPALLHLENAASPHGLVLKSSGTEKTILLVPRIEIDLEISENDIHDLPEVFSRLKNFFRGASFSGEDVILILDPDKLCEYIRRNQK